MVVLHCTQKLLKELRHPSLCTPVYSGTDWFKSWYANLLRFHKKKCVLFTNEKTLYSFIIPNVLRKDLEDIGTLFFTHLFSNLLHEGFPNNVVNQLTQLEQKICFAKTANRTVVGTMVDLDFHCFYLIESIDDFDRILDVNYKINRILWRHLEYKYPIEALSQTLGSNQDNPKIIKLY